MKEINIPQIKNDAIFPLEIYDLSFPKPAGRYLILLHLVFQPRIRAISSLITKSYVWSAIKKDRSVWTHHCLVSKSQSSEAY